MIKKYVYKVSFYILSAIILSGCNDFLDEKPKSDFTQEGTGSEDLTSKYLSISDAQTELQGAYNTYKLNNFQMEIFMLNDVQSDNCYVGGDGTNEEAVDLLTMTSTNSHASLVWSEWLTMIGTATNVIENTKLMKASAATDIEKNAVIAEAKFIRAWACFDLVRIFGGIPLVLQLIPTITSENLDTWYPVMYPKRTSEEKVYEQILVDLDETNTISYLPSKNTGAFQATKGAAYGLLAKVLATRGDKNSRNYTKVIDYCNKVINEGYKLVDNFDDLWNPDHKFTTESIFEVYYSADSPNWAYWVFLKEGDGSVTWRRYCTPTHDLVAKFDKEKDTRYASSILWRSVPYSAYWPADKYPLSYKIREKNSDIILMRLADIMLLKAEALVETGETGKAIDIVNTIRQRAGLGNSSLNKNMAQSEARIAVENERQLELYMEGQRWFDLTRNDRTIDVMRKHKDQKGNLIFKKIQEFRIKWPIPQGEMDKNTNLVQNEGY